MRLQKLRMLYRRPTARLRLARIRFKKQYYIFSSIWLAITAITLYSFFLLLLFAIYGQELIGFYSSPVVVTASTIFAPIVGFLSILIIKHVRKKFIVLVLSLRKPQLLYKYSIIAIIIISVLGAGLLVLTISEGTDEIIKASAQGPKWKYASLDSEFAKLNKISSGKSAEVYKAWIYTIAARQASDRDAIKEKQILVQATGMSKPVIIKFIANLGLANLAKANKNSSECLRRLDSAEFYSLFLKNDLQIMTKMQRGFLMTKLSAAASAGAERQKLLDGAEQSYQDARKRTSDDDVFQVLKIGTNLASCQALRGQWSVALNNWKQLIDLGMRQPKEKLAQDEMQSLLGDLHNNVAVASMVIKLWQQAVEELSVASGFKGGDDRRSLLNKLICYKRLGNAGRAHDIVLHLSPDTERAADFALFGWVSNGKERYRYYAKALNVVNLKKEEFSHEAADRLAQMCNDEYLGLHFSGEDFF